MYQQETTNGESKETTFEDEDDRVIPAWLLYLFSCFMKISYFFSYYSAIFTL